MENGVNTLYNLETSSHTQNNCQQLAFIPAHTFITAVHSHKIKTDCPKMHTLKTAF